MTGFKLTATAIVALWLPALAGSSPQQLATPQPWPELTSRLERAALKGSGQETRAIRTELLRRLTRPEEKPNTARLQYALAYAGWRMASMPDVPEREQTDLLDDAVTRLQEIVKAEPKDAEAHALLGSVYGLQAGRSTVRAMVAGPRASSALERAAKESAENPRVLLLQGVSSFNTPAMFGGSMERAERELRKSLELFAREPATKPWPNWGRFDAHVWLGQALLNRGDLAGARAEYDKALAIAPDSGWVRFSLIPALEKSAKR